MLEGGPVSRNVRRLSCSARRSASCQLTLKSSSFEVSMSVLGSKTVLTAPKRHFRSTPMNGHRQTDPVGPFRANTGSDRTSLGPGRPELLHHSFRTHAPARRAAAASSHSTRPFTDVLAHGAATDDSRAGWHFAFARQPTVQPVIFRDPLASLRPSSGRDRSFGQTI
jgi:hypothetical protein